jgi:hypothetical protein
MNQKNLDYLKEGLKYLGFGEGLNEKVAENINKKPNQFQLKTENQYGADKVSYVLDFKKGSTPQLLRTKLVKRKHNPFSQRRTAASLQRKPTIY